MKNKKSLKILSFRTFSTLVILLLIKIIWKKMECFTLLFSPKRTFNL